MSVGGVDGLSPLDGSSPEKSPEGTGLLNALLLKIVSGPSPPKRSHLEVQIHFP